MINFSLLTPTRKRPKHLWLYLETLFKVTEDMSKIEVQIGVDKDDDSWKVIIEYLKKTYPEKGKSLIVHSRFRGTHIEEHYINWLASFSKGKYIMMTNDDCLFRTEGWDIKVFKRLEEYIKDKPDGLVFGVVNDKEKERRELEFLQSDFTLLSRSSIEALGFFLEPRYSNATADTNIAHIYHLLGRVLDLTKVCTIEHRPLEMKKLKENYIAAQDPETIRVQSKIKRESFLRYDTYSLEHLHTLQKYIRRKSG